MLGSRRRGLRSGSLRRQRIRDRVGAGQLPQAGVRSATLRCGARGGAKKTRHSTPRCLGSDAAVRIQRNSDVRLTLCVIAVSSLLFPGIAESQTSATIRDSAHVRLVTHGTVRYRLAPFIVEPKATLDLDGLRSDPEEELNGRRPFLTARPLSDGRWIVVDWATLKLFDQRGRYIRTIGREGSGPGEFHQLREVCVTQGDTIIGISLNDRRISVFDSTGKHVRSIVASGDVKQSPCLADGSILVRLKSLTNPASTLASNIASLMDRVAPVERIRWDGSRIDSLGLMQIETLDETFEDYANIAVLNSRIHVGNGSEPEYRVYSSDGDLTQIVRWNAVPVPVTSKMIDARTRRGYPIGRVRREFLPYYAMIRLSANDEVWVQDYRTPGDSMTSYTIFTRTGDLVGRLRMPMASPTPVDVPWIGTDRVLLAWRDVDGSPHLSLHRLSRESAPTPAASPPALSSAPRAARARPLHAAPLPP